MSLLYWSTVSPEGASRLAAIRFAAPIQISSIRIFPNGAQPFANAPDVVARTEPDSFFLEVFLNAHPVAQTDAKEKPRIANALVPTLIAYPGGQVDFSVNMGSEYTTRLMIVKGKFDVLSLAIYGNILTDAPLAESYEARPLPSLEPVPLTQAMDPGNSRDPTLLARQLLALIPNSPPLSLVVRLMFCLKPSHDDWNLPEFPYLHANLDLEMEDLETIIQVVSRPIRDDVTEESLSTFASKIADCPKDSDYAYHVANLLSISAPQHPGLARALLHHLDLWSIFDPQNLDESTLLCLLDAATNVDIARHLNNEAFLNALYDLQTSFRTDKLIQTAARRLSTRILHWSYYEDALSNIQGDFNQSVDMLKDVSTDEHALGTWLESMITHNDVVTKLAENPVLPIPQSRPSLRFHNVMNITSHGDFIIFVRAFIGIASVLAVWAWMDELGNDVCREQALAIIHLWQGIDGYREIVNYLLLVRQLTRRLKWIISDNDLPRKSGILAEKVFVNVSNDPYAFLQEEIINTVSSLQPPLSFITDDELRTMQKVAYVSEDGLPAAVDELLYISDHPLSHRRLRVLRVALTIVQRELDSAEGEWRTLQTFWDWESQSPGLVHCLVDLLVGVSGDLNGHFVISAPSGMNQALVEQLFRIADDILRLVVHLTSVLPLTTRSMRRLTVAVADIFACTDLADMIFSQTSLSAQETRQACLHFVRSLSGPGIFVEPGKLGAEVILRTLLQHAGHSSSRDPAYHLLQVFTMIDYVLPEHDGMYDGGDLTHWVTAILPNVLDELKLFFRILDPGNKVHFVKRLIKVDEGITEIGEWILIEELRYLSGTLGSLASSICTADYRLVLLHQAFLSIQFILNLIAPSSALSTWCTDAISNTPDLSSALKSCLTALMDGHYTSSHLRRLTFILTQSARSFDPNLRFTILLAGLRASQEDDSTSELLGLVVDILRDDLLTLDDPESLRFEIGKTLLSYSNRQFDTATSESLFRVLEWLSQNSTSNFTTLSSITSEAFAILCSSLLASLPEHKHAILSSIRLELKVSDETDIPAPVTVLPDTLTLPLRNVSELLQPQGIPNPSTPRRGMKTPDILGPIISPPTALLRAHGVMSTTGLTKTYSNNDFRQLRQIPSARQNTSRLPSMHVDVGINGHLTL